MIWWRRGYDYNMCTHCTDILWFTLSWDWWEVGGVDAESRDYGSHSLRVSPSTGTCLLQSQSTPTSIVAPTSYSQQRFLEDFSSASHVTIKTSPACTIMDGLLFWRGWEIIFRMRRESTALVLLLAGVTSQVLFIFGVLYFNINSEFQCQRYHVQRQGLPNVYLIYAFREWPRNAQTCLRPK